MAKTKCAICAVGFFFSLQVTPAYPYAFAGWTKDDKNILIYHRYDIWEFDTETGKGEKIIRGREDKTVSRYEKLDNDERFLSSENNWLFSTFNKETKNAGFYQYNPKNSKGTQLIEGSYNFRDPKKSEFKDALIFTRESFQEFPNIWYLDQNFKNTNLISDANPQ